MTTLTPEEAVHRVKTALAEMGYPDFDVYWDGRYCEIGTPLVIGWWTNLPDVVVWMTAAVAFPEQPCPCWACFRTHDPALAAACWRDDDCAHPEGPARPPRELLVAAR